MTLQEFNGLQKEEAIIELTKCCGAGNWVNQMQKAMPFENEEILIQTAANIWFNSCHKEDYLEAFTHHPKIGDLNSLKQKFENTKSWASNEQAGVAVAEETTILALAKANKNYENKFGYIFIVSASGKSAQEMLTIIQKRLEYQPDEELAVAMGEQHKITSIRLAKLMPELNHKADLSSHITTHVLDTSSGSPGKGMPITMLGMKNGNWQAMTVGVTNEDGRISNLLPPGTKLAPGKYKMLFDTNTYFKHQNTSGFYPEVDIQFIVTDESHYHIPLLISPFGYTTYRGS